MKKIVALIALCFPLIAFAQIEKGNILLSGNVGFFTSSIDNDGGSPDHRYLVQLSPYLGKFVSSRVAVGLYGSYRREQYKNAPQNVYAPSKTVQDSYSVGPFVRYYHPIGEKFYMFAQGDFTFNKSSYKQYYSTPDIGGSDSLSKGARIAVRPGIAYYLTNHLALELMLGSVSYYKGDDGSDLDFDFITRGLSTGVAFTF